MVVAEDNGGCPFHERLCEDLAGVADRAVDKALRDQDCPHEFVRSIEHHNEENFLRWRLISMMSDKLENVLRTPAGFVADDASEELQCSHGLHVPYRYGSDAAAS